MRVNGSNVVIKLASVDDSSQVVFQWNRDANGVHFRIRLLGAIIFKQMTVSILTITVIHVRVGASIPTVPLRETSDQIRIFDGQLCLTNDRIRSGYLYIRVVNGEVVATVLSSSTRNLKAYYGRWLLTIQ